MLKSYKQDGMDWYGLDLWTHLFYEHCSAKSNEKSQCCLIDSSAPDTDTDPKVNKGLFPAGVRVNAECLPIPDTFRMTIILWLK